MKLNKLFSKYESMLYLLVKLFIFFIVLWMFMFIIPSLFIFLFDSYIGNLVLLGLIILTGIYSLRFAIGYYYDECGRSFCYFVYFLNLID